MNINFFINRGNSILNLKWLPATQRINCNFLKIAHKTLNQPDYPTYLQLIQNDIRSTDRNNSNSKLHVPKSDKTFTGKASRLINELLIKLSNSIRAQSARNGIAIL